jgi:DNA-binding NarL/FixJ family response regulator
LKAIGHAPDQPLIVVMTFECHPLIQRQCMELGAHMFFDKADDLEVLLEALKNLAAGECTLADLKHTVHSHPN